MKFKPFLFILLTTFSCSVKNDTIADFQNKLTALSSAKLVIEDYNKVLVIPGAGCSGCVSGAENFVKENIHQIDEILIIFTAIPSQKMLKVKLGIDLDRHNIYLDLDNQFNSGKVYSFYPTIFYMKDGNALDLDYVSPENKYLLNNLANDRE